MEEKLLALLEKIENAEEWENPMLLAHSQNIFTKKEYRGFNRFTLSGGQFATFNQIRKHGGKVKKGSKAQSIFFYTMLKKKELDAKGKEQFFPMLKTFNVFNINDTEGLDDYKVDNVRPDPLTNEELEKVKVTYLKQLGDFTTEVGRAYYSPATDKVNVPEISMFKSDASHYATLFHELTHSTGASERLGRAGVAEADGFGSEKYSREELIAELGAMLCLENTTSAEESAKNSLSYLKSWMRELKDKPKEIITAFSRAEKARDFIFNIPAPCTQ